MEGLISGVHLLSHQLPPSLYIPLQVVTSTPIHTMEVSSSFQRIEKFSGRPGTISLREFKATFSIVVCELELKYGMLRIQAQLIRFHLLLELENN